MECALIGGDLRFAHAARLLRDMGVDARVIAGEQLTGVEAASLDELSSARVVIANYPPQVRRESVTLDDIRNNMCVEAKLILAGPKPAPCDALDLTRDEVFLRRNAVLTAEGAICAMMNAGVRSLYNSRALVIGGGRIGGALYSMLKGLGANVLLASRTGGDVRTSYMTDVLRDVDFVFSTPPAIVLSRRELACVRRGAYIIDLASPPYGVDMDAARELNVNAWREPALPGRYCPESAARVILECGRVLNA